MRLHAALNECEFFKTKEWFILKWKVDTESLRQAKVGQSISTRCFYSFLATFFHDRKLSYTFVRGFLTSDFMFKHDCAIYFFFSFPFRHLNSVQSEFQERYFKHETSKLILFPKRKSDKTGSIWQHRKESFVA